MHGRGTYKWPNGKKYVGDYKNDKKEGKGTYSWPDGREYDGEWKNGVQHGTGRFRSKAGTVKTGVWEKGKRARWVNIVNPDGTTRPIDSDNDQQSEEGDNISSSSIVRSGMRDQSRRIDV